MIFSCRLQDFLFFRCQQLNRHWTCAEILYIFFVGIKQFTHVIYLVIYQLFLPQAGSKRINLFFRVVNVYIKKKKYIFPKVHCNRNSKQAIHNNMLLFFYAFSCIFNVYFFFLLLSMLFIWIFMLFFFIIPAAFSFFLAQICKKKC